MLAQAQSRPAALLVLACLRKGETLAKLAAGFGIGTCPWRAGRLAKASCVLRAREAYG